MSTAIPRIDVNMLIRLGPLLVIQNSWFIILTVEATPYGELIEGVSYGKQCNTPYTELTACINTIFFFYNIYQIIYSVASFFLVMLSNSNGYKLFSQNNPHLIKP